MRDHEADQEAAQEAAEAFALTLKRESAPIEQPIGYKNKSTKRKPAAVRRVDIDQKPEKGSERPENRKKRKRRKRKKRKLKPATSESRLENGQSELLPSEISLVSSADEQLDFSTSRIKKKRIKKKKKLKKKKIKKSPPSSLQPDELDDTQNESTRSVPLSDHRVEKSDANLQLDDVIAVENLSSEDSWSSDSDSSWSDIDLAEQTADGTFEDPERGIKLQTNRVPVRKVEAKRPVKENADINIEIQNNDQGEDTTISDMFSALALRKANGSHQRPPIGRFSFGSMLPFGKRSPFSSVFRPRMDSVNNYHMSLHSVTDGSTAENSLMVFEEDDDIDSTQGQWLRRSFSSQPKKLIVLVGGFLFLLLLSLSIAIPLSINDAVEARETSYPSVSPTNAPTSSPTNSPTTPEPTLEPTAPPVP